MEVDTGGEVSAMSLTELKKVFGDIELQPADCSL